MFARVLFIRSVPTRLRVCRVCSRRCKTRCKRKRLNINCHSYAMSARAVRLRIVCKRGRVPRAACVRTRCDAREEKIRSKIMKNTRGSERSRVTIYERGPKAPTITKMRIFLIERHHLASYPGLGTTHLHFSSIIERPSSCILEVRTGAVVSETLIPFQGRRKFLPGAPFAT